MIKGQGTEDWSWKTINENVMVDMHLFKDRKNLKMWDENNFFGEL